MISGVFAASITPLNQDFSPDLESLPPYLNHLAERGCHGALILGTTGEGPSFSPEQRVAIFKSALQVRQNWPEFRLLAGVGTPSLEETSKLTRRAFDIGMDGVVILPPFYFRNVGDEGLLSWFLEILRTSVPPGGITLIYHIPALTGISLSIDLISRLHDSAPNKFIGLKDSSGDKAFSAQLGDHFGDELCIFTGNDRLFTEALNNHAAGCITALANLISPDLNDLWTAKQTQAAADHIQMKISDFREICEQFQPFPPLIKFLVNKYFNFPRWPVCPPLVDLQKDSEFRVSAMLNLA
ncbi:MAG: dihydrodipicolinate synthase family protein [Anaerolineales bacterium]